MSLLWASDCYQSLRSVACLVCAEPSLMRGFGAQCMSSRGTYYQAVLSFGLSRRLSVSCDLALCLEDFGRWSQFQQFSCQLIGVGAETGSVLGGRRHVG